MSDDKTTLDSASARLRQMDFPEWRKRNNDLAKQLLREESKVEVWCRVCDGEGTVECTYPDCDNVHEKQCEACNGDGIITTDCNEKNLEDVMLNIYNEQIIADRSLLNKWEKDNAVV